MVFFYVTMRLNIYLDYQNLHPTQFGFFLPKLHKIYIFAAEGQKLPEKTADQLITYPGKIKLIRVQGTSKNNLDFHMAFLLGRHHQKLSRKVGFIIVSKDKGFDYLIQHLNAMGRKIIRAESISEKVLTEFTAEETVALNPTEALLPQYIHKFLAVIAKTSREVRPRKPKKVLNFIASICIGFEDKELIYKELLKKGTIQIKQNQVIYFDEVDE